MNEIIPSSPVTETSGSRARFIAGVRAFADWLETNPAVKEPQDQRMLLALHTNEAGARDELASFRFEGWSFGDTSEWDFSEYTPGFLHCCFAIRRGIDLWDAARKTAEVAA